jgi:hypothetical protein
LVDFYLWVLLTIGALGLNHYCARQIRHLCKSYCVMATFFTLAVTNAFILFCWQEALYQLDTGEPAWVMLFVASIAGAVISGLLHTEPEAGSRSVFWSAAAALRRPYNDVDAMRKQYKKKKTE